MRLLVFQHLECEHPGSLRQFLNRDGVQWDAVELDKNEAIPELDRYDALWVMGGPMDVWDIEEYPWLIEEKIAIRTWVRELGKPFLGLCLGHQLLADALGGTCGPQRPAEIGVMDVELTDGGVIDPLFAGLDRIQKCLNWHSVQVAQAPDDAVILASSSACTNQAMRVGVNAWSMQYHVEVELDTVTNWADVPAYHAALINSLGEDGVEKMSKGAAQNMHKFLVSSEAIYNNFIRLVGV